MTKEISNAIREKFLKPIIHEDVIDNETFTIEGDHHSVCVINDVLYIDSKPFYKGDSKYKVVKIIVNGNVKNVDGTSIEINGDVSGDVDATCLRRG